MTTRSWPFTLENLTGTFVAEVYDVQAAPGEFTADFQVAPPPAGAIVSSVTTDQPVYQAGQTVTMTFTETNVSDQAVMVPTGQNGFAFDQVLPAPNLDLEDYPGLIGDGRLLSPVNPGHRPRRGRSLTRVGSLHPRDFQRFDLNGNMATFEVSARLRPAINIGDRGWRFILDGTGHVRGWRFIRDGAGHVRGWRSPHGRSPGTAVRPRRGRSRRRSTPR